jgi:RimJ/RimL family protein N-acetyltransferase
MGSPFDIRIETERLILRVPRQEDFPAWAAYMQDEEAARYIGGVTAAPPAWRGMASIVGSWALLGFGMFSLIERATGEWVGRAGPWRPEGWPGPEIGWGIVRSRWGRGLALEAAIACMDFAVDRLGWADVIHSIHPDNVNSQRLAERLGSIRRGPGRLPPPFEAMPTEIWGQSAAEWKARRANLALRR